MQGGGARRRAEGACWKTGGRHEVQVNMRAGVWCVHCLQVLVAPQDMETVRLGGSIASHVMSHSVA